MLQSVGPQVLNGWNAFNAAITGGSVPLSDCDFFSVNVIGTWVGTLKWMGSLDNVNWFDMALQNANGAVTPAVSLTSTGTDKNGNYFASAGSGLLYVRVVASAWTSGTAYVYTAKHRGTYVSSQDFWDTAMPFTRDAVFAIDASRSSVGETVVVNAGSGGTALNATLGSTGSADSNDPLLLPWTGENYVYVPGVAGSYIRGGASTSTINTTGDLEVVTRFALDDWAQPTTGGAAGVVSKAEIVGQRSWWIRVGNNGTIFSWTADGTTVIAATTVTLPVFTAGSTWWLKHTLDVDDSAGNRVHSVWYAPDQVDEPTSWTLAATNTVVGVTSIFAGTDIIAFGTSTMASQQSSGKYKRLIIRHSIGGAKVFDLNLGTEVASGAQTTVTDSVAGSTLAITRSTAGRKCVAVTRPVWLFGTDDYMEVADNALLNMDASQSFTVVAVVRQWATPASFGRYVDKKVIGANGWSLESSGTTAFAWAGVNDGTTLVTRSGLSAITAGTMTTTGMVVDRTSQTLSSISNATLSASITVSTVGPIGTTTSMRVGAVGDASATGFQDFELLAVAVFRRALTATEIATINTYYGTA